jgi:hypothetical protein
MFPFWSKKKPKAITKERIIVGTQASNNILEFKFYPNKEMMY